MTRARLTQVRKMKRRLRLGEGASEEQHDTSSSQLAVRGPRPSVAQRPHVNFVFDNTANRRHGPQYDSGNNISTHSRASAHSARSEGVQVTWPMAPSMAEGQASAPEAPPNVLEQAEMGPPVTRTPNEPTLGGEANGEVPGTPTRRSSGVSGLPHRGMISPPRGGRQAVGLSVQMPRSIVGLGGAGEGAAGGARGQAGAAIAAPLLFDGGVPLINFNP